MKTKAKRNAEIIRLYKAGGWTYNDLAVRFHLTPQRVYQVLRGGGVIKKRRARKETAIPVITSVVRADTQLHQSGGLLGILRRFFSGESRA